MLSKLVLPSTLLGLAAGQLTGRGFPDCDNGPLKNNKVCDKSAGTEAPCLERQRFGTDEKVDPLERATALINQFTIEEKLNNTGHVSPGVPRLGLPAYTWWQEALHGVADSPGKQLLIKRENQYDRTLKHER